MVKRFRIGSRAGMRVGITLLSAFVQSAAVFSAVAAGADAPSAESTDGLGAAGQGVEAAAGTDFSSLLFVLMLSTFIGLGVITRVSRLLHTPLMSLTNAISAIAVVGAIVVVGTESHHWLITLLGAVALFASITNIVSGFLITDRMLKMFKQPESPKP